MPDIDLSPPWPTLDPLALHGLAGEVVSLIEPHTESDPVALLVSFLGAFGNAVGPKPHMVADGAEHPARLFAVIAGQSSKARKGTSWRNIRRLFEFVDSNWADNCILGGMATGEGLIGAVRDPQAEKRCLCVEEEFARTLVNSGRGNNTLSQVVREAFDNGNLRTMTKKPMTATRAHVSIIGHVTLPELQQRLSYIHRTSGFANRYLYFVSKRSKLLPSGGDLSTTDLSLMAIRVRDALDAVDGIQEMRRTPAAEREWERLYAEMDVDARLARGPVADLTARSEAHVLRLSVVYALLDSRVAIDVEHVRAAYALWQYSRESLDYIFGFGDPVIEKLWSSVVESGGLTRTEQMGVFQKNLHAEDLERARHYLVDRGLCIVTTRPSAGRPAEVLTINESTK